VPAVLDADAALYNPLCDIPLIAQNLLRLNRIPLVDEIILVVREAELLRMARICKNFSVHRVRKVVCAKEGGIHALTVGIYECERESDYVAIHDPLCPFVSGAVWAQTFSAAIKHGAAAPAVPVKDTIKLVEDGVICETPDRAALQAVQSPLIAESSLLKAALAQARDQETDSADVLEILEQFGVPLRLVEGTEENIRIGSPADLLAAEAVLGWT